MTVFAFGKGFVFVANTRATSSTTHHLLLPHADAIFYRPVFGKHFTLPQIARRAKAMSGLDLGALFTFGIVREPLSWLHSWFRFRRREELKRVSSQWHSNLVPEEVRFPEFLEEACGSNPRAFARIEHQSNYFRDTAGRVAVNYIAVYSDLHADCRRLSEFPPLSLLGGLEKMRMNASPDQRSPSVKIAWPDLSQRMALAFEDDFELFERAARAEFRDLSSIAPVAEFRLRLDDRERREDVMSRIMLHFSLGEREAVARLMPLLDIESRSDEHIKWICKQTN
jgi:hypothetical protein